MFSLLSRIPSRLMVRDAITCELTKLAVEPEEQGKGIGYLLGNALVEKASKRGFKRIVLEGNTKMKNSITLYKKLGFKEVPFEYINHEIGNHKRCNIFMELI